ncbi:unnamed protein product [Diatraea saccharalis]|uniref:BZIP domain-containing protein n=1 Tax=Diatraea saccharalis TaxID=40085 RepID=A0A9N9W6K2_9NEOP|nr:unnamed protein product [Diatraea saccharalis]
MDTDILSGSKDYLYADDFLNEFTNESMWSSLLVSDDATPSEILADAAPALVPPISPILSDKSTPESSNSDSGSEDDSKNSSSSASMRQSSQSPIDWMTIMKDEPSSSLSPEDVELFLQKSNNKVSPIPSNDPISTTPPERTGPVMAIENGIIKGVKSDIGPKLLDLPAHIQQNGNTCPQNSYFKVVNENFYTNNNIKNDVNHKIVNNQIKVIVEQKKIPSILKRSSNLFVKAESPTIVVPAGSTKGGKIAISPLLQTKYSDTQTNNVKTNGYQLELPQPKSVVVNAKQILSQSPAMVHNTVSPKIEAETLDNSSILDFSHMSEAEIRAVKKQQRMIKNRESACQSRQKKKEYVSALEQQLLEAHQEIAKLRLENKLLRDKLENNGRGRKIPKIDASILIPKKNIAVIFAMVFMVSMNWNVLGWNSKPLVGPSGPHQNTRHLLWSDENSDSMLQTDSNDNNTYGIDCQNLTTQPDFARVNHTESIRIAKELNHWIGGGKTLNWTYNPTRKKRRVYLNEEKITGDFLETYKLFNKLNLDNNLLDIISAKAHVKNAREKARHRRLRRNREIDFEDNAVINYESLYRKPIRKTVDDFHIDDLSEWSDLLKALQRRDDTFYVVGVGKGEHLLLPAVSHNVTRPPRMALILPARTGNDSLMTDHVTLMQIDCSVVNTTLVKLKSETLPESLRKNVDNDSKSSTHEPSVEINGNDVKKSNKLDAKLPKGLHNTSNISNYRSDFKKEVTSMHKEIPKDDSFTQYLFSKVDDKQENIDSKYYKSNRDDRLSPVTVLNKHSLASLSFSKNRFTKYVINSDKVK